ncbi:MAG: hypothetical protein KIT54_04580 [Phycisphaeraceae bacterium]|nr:hypothetical protein [Phycisphaeraceae bacterium]
MMLLGSRARDRAGVEGVLGTAWPTRYMCCGPLMMMGVVGLNADTPDDWSNVP